MAQLLISPTAYKSEVLMMKLMYLPEFGKSSIALVEKLLEKNSTIGPEP
jgi:hypothetical protein